MLLDVEMPGMTGFDVREAMKHDPILSKVPVIFVTSYDAKDLLQAPRSQSGPAVFINKPLNSAQLTSAVRRQLRPRQATPAAQPHTAAAEAVRPALLPARPDIPTPLMSRIEDERRRGLTLLALTSVASRRQFDETLEREWERCRQAGLPMATMLVEIDQLKALDEAGRVFEGDRLLTFVAQTLLAASLRPEDLVARHGDAQFLMLLPQMSAHAARQLAEGILHRVATRAPAEGGASPSTPVSVSIGIGVCDKDHASWHEPAPAPVGSDTAATGSAGPGSGLASRSGALVDAAAGALTVAVQAGRNQVQVIEVAHAGVSGAGQHRSGEI
jgi:diguanylate cyclase (GGDEF)-like protein